MTALDGADLLRLWERGAALHPIDRALLILALADPGRTGAELARLPLGRRDALLLAVRARTLGERLEAHERCPVCAEHVEFELDCATLAGGDDAPLEPWSVEAGGMRLAVRALDSFDAAAAVAAGPAAAYDELLQRAVVSAEPMPAGELPAEVAAAVAASLAEHDPRAELALDVRCPGCGHRWQTVLDVAGFVWAELMARAQRMLQDVHLLARAYGWSEPEILALGDSRRAAYVALAAG